MATYLTHSSVHNSHLEEDDTDEWNSSSGGFDCNICLDNVQDPVVTICGHLYCWPCIYKWIHQHRIISSEISQDHDDHPQCPVCKSKISEKTLIPLYGRGQSDEKAEDFEPIIPHRPKGLPHEVATLATTSQRDYGYSSAPDVNLAGSIAFHPMISMFREMICTRFFGTSQRLYTYPNSYGVVLAGSARARRNVMQVDQSLSRLSFFLCCCLVLCLVCF